MLPKYHFTVDFTQIHKIFYLILKGFLIKGCFNNVFWKFIYVGMGYLDQKLRQINKKKSVL